VKFTIGAGGGGGGGIVQADHCFEADPRDYYLVISLLFG